MRPVSPITIQIALICISEYSITFMSGWQNIVIVFAGLIATLGALKLISVNGVLSV